MDTNIRKIQAFCVAARLGSISAAARELGSAQSTLSRSISSLEDDWGIRLFERKGPELRLTTDGKRLLEESLELCESFSRLERRVRLGIGDETLVYQVVHRNRTAIGLEVPVRGHDHDLILVVHGRDEVGARARRLRPRRAAPRAPGVPLDLPRAQAHGGPLARHAGVPRLSVMHNRRRPMRSGAGFIYAFARACGRIHRGFSGAI